MVGIIAVLSAIIGPALWDAKAAARKSACAFSLRQMGVGLISYVQDYDGCYPQTKGHSTSQPQIDDAAGAIELPDRGNPITHLGAYTTGVADCPSDPDPMGDTCANLPGASLDTRSYLTNGYFVWGLTESQVRGDASTIYLAERRSFPVGHVPPNCDVIFRPWYNPTNPLAPQNDMDPKKGAIATQRHRGGANYLFADNHCGWLSFDEVWSPPDHDFLMP